jgi:hypothetical protein
MTAADVFLKSEPSSLGASLAYVDTICQPQMEQRHLVSYPKSTGWSCSVTKQMLGHCIGNIPDQGLVLIGQDDNDEMLIRMACLKGHEPSTIPRLRDKSSDAAKFQQTGNSHRLPGGCAVNINSSEPHSVNRVHSDRENAGLCFKQEPGL